MTSPGTPLEEIPDVLSSFALFVDALASHLGRTFVPAIDESFEGDSLEMLLITVWLEELGVAVEGDEVTAFDTWGALYFWVHQTAVIGG